MSAKIWYQTPGAKDVTSIDLGLSLSSVEEDDWRDEVVAQAVSGQESQVVFTATRTVHYTCDLITDYDVIRKLEALASHLRRGGLCTVAENGTKTLGSFLGRLPRPDSVTIQGLENLYSGYGGSWTATAAAGDILCLRGPSPELLYEEVSYASNTGLTITLEAAPVYDWRVGPQPWCFVRNKGFWPILRLRRGTGGIGRRIITTDRRISFQLDLDMEEPPHAFDAIAIAPHEPFAVTNIEFHGLDDKVNQTGVYEPVGGSGPAPSGTAGGWW
jgi:hypothetical protein